MKSVESFGSKLFGFDCCDSKVSGEHGFCGFCHDICSVLVQHFDVFGYCCGYGRCGFWIWGKHHARHARPARHAGKANHGLGFWFSGAVMDPFLET